MIGTAEPVGRSRGFSPLPACTSHSPSSLQTLLPSTIPLFSLLTPSSPQTVPIPFFPLTLIPLLCLPSIKFGFFTLPASLWSSSRANPEPWDTQAPPAVLFHAVSCAETQKNKGRSGQKGLCAEDLVPQHSGVQVLAEHPEALGF